MHLYGQFRSGLHSTTLCMCTLMQASQWYLFTWYSMLKLKLQTKYKMYRTIERSMVRMPIEEITEMKTNIKSCIYKISFCIRFWMIMDRVWQYGHQKIKYYLNKTGSRNRQWFKQHFYKRQILTILIISLLLHTHPYPHTHTHTHSLFLFIFFLFSFNLFPYLTIYTMIWCIWSCFIAVTVAIKYAVDGLDGGGNGKYITLNAIDR